MATLSSPRMATADHPAALMYRCSHARCVHTLARVFITTTSYDSRGDDRTRPNKKTRTQTPRESGQVLQAGGVARTTPRRYPAPAALLQSRLSTKTFLRTFSRTFLDSLLPGIPGRVVHSLRRTRRRSCRCACLLSLYASNIRGAACESGHVILRTSMDEGRYGGGWSQD